MKSSNQNGGLFKKKKFSSKLTSEYGMSYSDDFVER